MLQDRLREAREKHGLSARALAKEAGVSAGYVGLIESGAKKNITAETAIKLATALGVSVQWLLTGDLPPSGTLPADADATGPHRAASGDDND